MFDSLGPRRKSLRFESLEDRTAPGVFLPFWVGALEEVESAVTESVVRSLREENGEKEDRRMGDSPVRDASWDFADGRIAHPTRVVAEESPFIRFPAVHTPTASNLLANLFSGYGRDVETPILKSRGEANFASRGAAFGALWGGANVGGGSGAAGDSGAPRGASVPSPSGGGLGWGEAASEASPPPQPSPAGGGSETAPTELLLVDAAGVALDVTLDENTIVVGAATWCGACAQFKAQLAQVSSQLTGLRLVFAFGDEGGSGPGGVVNPSYLAGLPGEVAFLAPNSIQPERFPSAFNPETNAFDRHAATAVGDWLARNASTQGSTAGQASSGTQAEDCGCGSYTSPPPQPSPSGGGSEESGGGSGGEEDLSGGGGVALAGDYNGDGRVNAIDYVVFRDTFGSMTDLRADGSEDLSINLADYPVWVANFGNEQGPGAFSITAPLSPSSTSDILIQWEASPSATSYQVVLSDFADLSDPFRTDVVTATSKAYNDLGDRTLYIGVFAMNAAGTTPATNGPYSLVIDTPDLRQIIFVTELEYYLEEGEYIPPNTVYFGSALVADYQCTQAANSAGLLDEPWDGSTIHYRAMLSLDLVELSDRISIGNFGFLNVNGDQIAANQTELYSGNFTAPILTQNGNTVVGIAPVWTGLTGAGQWSGATCSNWHDPFAAGATVGNVNGVGGTWLDNGTRACHLGARLYCINVD